MHDTRDHPPPQLHISGDGRVTASIQPAPRPLRWSLARNRPHPFKCCRRRCGRAPGGRAIVFALRQGCSHFCEVRGGCVWGSVLVITWTRAVISCRVNCCRRPVFKKTSGFNITINRRRLAAAADPPPANSIFLQHRHRRLANADSPMFQQAPMSPIFNVRCVHRPNSSSNYCC